MSVPVSVRLPESVARRLDEFARARGVTRSEAVRLLILEASTGARGDGAVASQREVLELLTEQARHGKVTAQRELLGHYQDGGGDAVGWAKDVLAERRAQRGA